MTFSLIFFPFSPTINSFTSFSTSSLFALVSISIPISHSLQMYLQFVGCSAKNGPTQTLALQHKHFQ
uniref:Uncharacterized protein n=1 Tax=Glycine max TaxID=3847 RepID=C6T7Y0_SOYBN|nr:unknown [Glycine max]